MVIDLIKIETNRNNLINRIIFHLSVVKWL